ncbi:non-ribosomal peptide synthetase [Saccharothrix variisporea]|uniref:Amino acid adenylation domain-containing protein n=1 Tax=Saccharothrix variisporea TaxID=543527 RepID=A0A495XNU6_9PSEU|nr:non-ribosomal peptide synthetase [Saccharothrix variisporea]RKT74566.1 amino acid adenylation domain-containing protein [Saccharothrix variisporea]
MTGPVVLFDFLPLPDLLRRAAARDADRVAVRDAERALSYRELVEAAHRVANHLLDLGCVKGDRVVSRLPRGVDAVVAQVAIMAAGCVYVPVDADYPPAVLDEMLARITPRHVIDDLDDPAIKACSTRPPEVRIDPADGAYVIHTSGSTGTPKAVLVSHGAITQSTLARWHRYPDLVDGFLMVSPMTFDSSMAGVWWTLTQGGTLVLAPPDPVALVAELRRVLSDPATGVSHTLLTPTLYRQVLDGLREPRTAVRHVVVAGEACPESLVRRHHEVLPDVELVNEYGPTEAAVWCTSGVLRPGEDVTIGTPIPNVALLVVGEDGEPVPAGEDGELCVTGDQLAAGYLGDPELTARRFVPLPGRPDRTMYRTGDRARVLPDGRFAVTGRLDDQVKVRGHRVDLAGVRARLAECRGVSDVALALKDRPSDGKVLTAYVVPVADLRAVEAEVRDTWAQVVDEVADTASAAGTDFDTSGWKSSYTGELLPDEDMVEWVEHTTAVLREGEPRSVLDLGCGTGLPLLRVAPHTDRYVGVDVSARTLDGLRRAVDAAGLSQVELRRGEASDVADFAGGGFDLVVSNSVSQYFPGADYLDRTVRGAVAATGTGGRVVLGDVRDLSLLWEFHTSIALAKASEDTPADVIAARVARRVEDEAQLLVDPRWFATVPGVHAEVRPRRGWRHNEMTAFRFDAVLHTQAQLLDVEWREWHGMRELQALLDRRPEVVGFRRVPNARTAGLTAVAEALRTGFDGTVVDLRVLESARDLSAVIPEALFDLAQTHGYRCHLSRAAGWDGGAFDLALVRRDFAPGALPRFPAPEVAGPLTTDPLRKRAVGAVRGTLVTRLREHADAVLVPHERPGAYVVLAELPTTRHGKVDFAALPAPDLGRPELDTPFVAPRTAAETAVAEVWRAVLGLDRVGVDDDFVELGGDSLLAATCAVRLTEQLDVALPSGALFSAPTVRELALLVENATPRTPAPAVRREGGSLPLTSAQTAFWFLDHYRRPGGSRHPDFALPVHYRISGPLDVDALRHAVDQLVARHEALRTKVLLEAYEGTQVVEAATTDVLAVTRVAGDPDALLRAAARDDATRVLDPATGQVFTAQLTSASDTEHLLVLRVHHMVADGWSIDVLERELEELYDAARSGRPHRLPDPPGYQDLVRGVDERFFVDLAWRDTEPYRSALTHWAQQTGGATPIRLSDDEPDGRPTELCHVDLDEAETAALLERARRAGATVFSAVVAALARVRAEDSGDPDVRLLTLNAARDEPGLDRMIGLLLNPMLIRLDVPPDAGLADVLPRAATTVREALAHGQVPLLALCEEIPDLMTVMTESQFVAVESLPPVRGLRLADCEVRRTDPFDDDFLGRGFRLPVELLVVARRVGTGLRLTALHDPAVVDGTRARSLLERLHRLLTDTPEDTR